MTVERALTVYGYDDAPHGHMEISLNDVRVPASNLLLGEGRGFEIAQGRLGPGRIHHCMRTIGAAEEALGAMARRLQSRVAFGKTLSSHSVWEQRIAKARIDIEMTRLLCLKAADMMDKAGNKAAQLEIAMIKVQAPLMALQILDDAIQAHGGGGVSGDFRLAHDWAAMRTLRFADGPDEAELESVIADTERSWLSALASIEERADHISHHALLTGDPDYVNTFVERLRQVDAARARADTRDWARERRERTRHLIELGGLVQKAGLVELLEDDRATLLGAFLELADKLQADERQDASRTELLARWRRYGLRAFDADTTTTVE